VVCEVIHTCTLNVEALKTTHCNILVETVFIV